MPNDSVLDTVRKIEAALKAPFMLLKAGDPLSEDQRATIRTALEVAKTEIEYLDAAIQQSDPAAPSDYL